MAAGPAGGTITVYRDLSAGSVEAGHRVRIVVAGKVTDAQNNTSRETALRLLEDAAARVFEGRGYTEFSRNLTQDFGGYFFVSFSIDGKLAESWGDVDQLRGSVAHYVAFDQDFNEADPITFDMRGDDAGVWLSDLESVDDQFENEYAAPDSEEFKRRAKYQSPGELLGETLHDEVAAVGGAVSDVATGVSSSAGKAAGGLLSGLFGIPVWLMLLLALALVLVAAFVYFRFMRAA